MPLCSKKYLHAVGLSYDFFAIHFWDAAAARFFIFFTFNNNNNSSKNAPLPKAITDLGRASLIVVFISY